MDNKLTILWTTGDPVTAEKFVLMYALNGKLQGWWDNVTLVIWGASAKLIAENESIREKMKLLADSGIELEACKACADQLGVADDLKQLGINVVYWGEKLTSIIKDSGHLLTV